MTTGSQEAPADGVGAKSAKREPENNETEQPEQFGDEEAETSSLAIIKENVSDFDVFQFAKSILAVIGILFIIIALCRMFYADNKGVAEVWDYSKVALNSIASLVLGLYFGKKK
jgi:hypothetical protein